MSKFKQIASTILVGLLGSALWEWGINPFSMFLSDKVIPDIIRFFNDSFYQKITSSTPESATYSIVIMLFFLVIFLPPNTISRMFHVDKTSWITFIYILVFFYIFMSNSLAHQINKRTLHDIEIIAPYISDLEYKTLKSDFYRIDSKDDYTALINQIQKYMDEYDLSE